MTAMPTLETLRLQIRPFTMADLAAIHHILDIELGHQNSDLSSAEMLRARERWLEWTVLNYEQLAWLYQPPYGDRAVILKATGQLVGAVGYVPCLIASGQLPYFSASPKPDPLLSPEVGLYYAISSTCQKQGYATEAAEGLINYAFSQMPLKRIIATTDYDNLASQGVMRKLGMRLLRNPFPNPPWLQVVGVLENNKNA